MRSTYIYLTICFQLCASLLFAQPPSAKLAFLTDTFALGRVVQLSLKITHPDTQVVIFPKTEKNLGIFEVVGQNFLPTQTQDHISTDEAHYQLQGFEVVNTAAVSLSYAYVAGSDTLTMQVDSDTIRLNERIANTDGLEKIAYKSFAGVEQVSDPLNPIVMVIGGILTLLVMGFFASVLNKPVRNYLRRQHIKREWANVRRQLQKLQAKQGQQAFYLDELNKLWKEIIGREHHIPFRSYTTSELLPLLNEQPFFSPMEKHNLRYIAKEADKVIYAGFDLNPKEVERMGLIVEQVLERFYEEKLNRK